MDSRSTATAGVARAAHILREWVWWQFGHAANSVLHITTEGVIYGGILEDVPDSHRDLLRSPLTATLATIDGRGRPHCTAVWYLVDDDGLLKGSITSDRVKYKNLSRNPNCDLFIIDPENPFRTLEVRAEAELTADPYKAMVAKFAEAYHVDEAMLKAAGDDRYTIACRPRRLVVNPPSQD